jgi:hypothetical protein
VGLWLVVFPLNAPAYHPQPGPIKSRPNRKVVARAYFGASSKENSGEEFILFVYAANRAATRHFRAYLRAAGRTGSYPGMSELPKGIKKLAQITVVRR